ncbi:hypothetical protein L1987_12917 [Smallanthus sonchifolius]|uniref:Uncharacterized protein n=1 Tax=Smallanthus sonchifolius TaxID=185202 RepID=A0ACB9JFY6_9ASTR|nr:hypothetical protein L1987_12917 [Smallanthus sonchifolius]
MLEVLNLGKNNINDTYPCSLGNNTNLRVLVLRSNRLHGSMHCSQNQHKNWSKLQILDIACNNLSGFIPKEYFMQWEWKFTKNCSSSTEKEANSQESEDGNDWQSIFYGMGVGAGSLIVISVSILCAKVYTTKRTTKKELSLGSNPLMV